MCAEQRTTYRSQLSPATTFTNWASSPAPRIYCKWLTRNWRTKKEKKKKGRDKLLQNQKSHITEGNREEVAGIITIQGLETSCMKLNLWKESVVSRTLDAKSLEKGPQWPHANPWGGHDYAMLILSEIRRRWFYEHAKTAHWNHRPPCSCQGRAPGKGKEVNRKNRLCPSWSPPTSPSHTSSGRVKQRTRAREKRFQGSL